MVVIAKKLLAYEFMPTVNMWCAHTLMLTKPMPDGGRDHDGYRKSAFRENTGMISDINAKAGIIRM